MIFELSGRGARLSVAEDVEEAVSRLAEMDSVGTMVFSGTSLGFEAMEVLVEGLGRHADMIETAILGDIFTGRLREEMLRSMEFVVKLLSECRRLKTLNLSDNALGHGGAELLCKYLDTDAALSLETLILNNNGLGQRGVVSLCGSLVELGKRGGRLSSISMGRNRMESPGAIALASAVEAHTQNMVEIAVYQNGITREGAIRLAKAAGMCEKLEILDFQDNTLGLEGARAVALDVLGSALSLRILLLNDCLLTRRGALVIIDALITSPPQNLSVLGLQYSQLRESDLDAIAALVPRLPDLKSLHLSGNCFVECDVLQEAFEKTGRFDVIDEISDVEDEEEEEQSEEEIDSLANKLSRTTVE